MFVSRYFWLNQFIYNVFSKRDFILSHIRIITTISINCVSPS